MAEVCECNLGLSNTGRPGCVPIIAVTSSLILVPLKTNAGVKNGIDLTATLNAAYWTAKLNAPKDERFFPLPPFEEVDQPKAESQVQEFGSGRKVKLREGKRSFTGQIIEDDASPEFLGKLKTAGCVDFGFYIVDTSGNLVGDYNEADNALYPIPADKNSWDPRLMLATDTVAQHILLEFDWDRLFRDERMKILTAEEAGQDFTELEGLVDVDLFDVSGTTTTITVSGKTCFGSVNSPVLYKGATDAADWSILDPATNLPLSTINTVTENPDATYELSFTPALVLPYDITIVVEQEGFEGQTTETIT